MYTRACVHPRDSIIFSFFPSLAVIALIPGATRVLPQLKRIHHRGRTFYERNATSLVSSAIDTDDCRAWSVTGKGSIPRGMYDNGARNKRQREREAGGSCERTDPLECASVRLSPSFANTVALRWLDGALAIAFDAS